MKTETLLLTGLFAVAATMSNASAGEKVKFVAPVESRITAELQDGSRVVGKPESETMTFQSPLLGEIKLPLARIRWIEWTAKTNTALLKAVNGDELSVTPTAKELRVKTSFGDVKLPTAALRRIGVTTRGGPVDLKQGLVALWSAEGNARDSVEGHDGEMVSGAGYGPGKVGRAFEFTTDRGRVYFADAPDFAMDGSFTLTGWVFIYDFPGPGGGGAIIQRGDDRPGFDPWVVGTTPDRQVNFASSTDANTAIEVKAPVKPSEWFHLACVYNQDEQRYSIYINGNLATEKSIEQRPMWKLDGALGPSVCLGNISGKFHTFPFRGRLDEWAVYARVLTPEEILALVDLGNAGEPLLPPSARQ